MIPQIPTRRATTDRVALRTTWLVLALGGIAVGQQQNGDFRPAPAAAEVEAAAAPREERGEILPPVLPPGAVTPLAVPAAAIKEPERAALLIKRRDAAWRYWDRVEQPGAGWAKTDFDDTDWKQGAGPLGYGDAHIRTSVAANEKAKPQILTTYFRHSFTLKDPAEATHLVGNLMCDDGAAVYLNGREVYRRNLPAGELKPSTPAVQSIGGKLETTYEPLMIERKLLQPGHNTIAIRVHQANANSRDLGFDFELRSVSERVAKLMIRQLAVDRPAPAAARPRARATRSFSHLSDGDVQYVGPDGIPRTQTQDALVQARSLVPGARFIRVIPGDTLAKLAAQHSLDVNVLALLNRTGTDKVYGTADIACLSWKHSVQPGEDFTQLAQVYNTTPLTLARLNNLKLNETPKPGEVITVPGEFNYQNRRQGHSYLRLARYSNTVRQVPYNQRSLKMRREKLKPGQSLKTLADRLQVPEAFIRQLNGLKADEPPKPGQWLLVDYSVELNEGATLEEVALFFKVPLDRLLAINGLQKADALPPGQRVQIPIGDRVHDQQQHAAARSTKSQVYEVVLGTPADDE